MPSTFSNQLRSSRRLLPRSSSILSVARSPHISNMTLSAPSRSFCGSRGFEEGLYLFRCVFLLLKRSREISNCTSGARRPAETLELRSKFEGDSISIRLLHRAKLLNGESFRCPKGDCGKLGLSVNLGAAASLMYEQGNFEAHEIG